jgi:ABC-type sugar transport system ATPase subunit
VAVIYITHNILDVMAVTDRLAILHRGRKAAEVASQDAIRKNLESLPARPVTHECQREASRTEFRQNNKTISESNGTVSLAAPIEIGQAVFRKPIVLLVFVRSR